MTSELDLENRDPKNINDHLGVSTGIYPAVRDFPFRLNQFPVYKDVN